MAGEGLITIEGIDVIRYRSGGQGAGGA
jgi:hypothetical protein